LAPDAPLQTKQRGPRHEQDAPRARPPDARSAIQRRAAGRQRRKVRSAHPLGMILEQPSARWQHVQKCSRSDTPPSLPDRPLSAYRDLSIRDNLRRLSITVASRDRDLRSPPDPRSRSAHLSRTDKKQLGTMSLALQTLRSCPSPALILRRSRTRLRHHGDAMPGRRWTQHTLHSRRRPKLKSKVVYAGPSHARTHSPNRIAPTSDSFIIAP
jgi:hypothetical protein